MVGGLVYQIDCRNPTFRMKACSGPLKMQLAGRKTLGIVGGPGQPNKCQWWLWDGHSGRRCLMVSGTRQSSEYGRGSLVMR